MNFARYCKHIIAKMQNLRNIHTSTFLYGISILAVSSSIPIAICTHSELYLILAVFLAVCGIALGVDAVITSCEEYYTKAT